MSKSQNDPSKKPIQRMAMLDGTLQPEDYIWVVMLVRNEVKLGRNEVVM
jgi:hypothetical protein